MSASGYYCRSADPNARWFSTGVDGSRPSSRAEHANPSSIDDIARSPTFQTACPTPGPGRDAEQPAAERRARPQSAVINRHSP